MTLIDILIGMLCIRIITIYISINNEQKLKREGAVEYGKVNSILLIITHILFYGASAVEAFYHQTTVDVITFIGIGLFIFSMAILFYVIHTLEGFWTVKLIIAPHHKLNQSFLFKYIRHPNYYFNVIPELFALICIFKAGTATLCLMPLYVIFLVRRILLEEKVMKEKFNHF